MSTAESQTEAPQLNAQCSRCNNRILLCKIRSKKNISLSADSHTSKCYCLLIHDALRIKRVYLQTSLVNTDRSFHSLYIVESYAESYGTLKLWNEVCCDDSYCSCVDTAKVFAKTWHFHYSVYFHCSVYFNKHLMDSHEAKQNCIQSNDAGVWFQCNSII